MFQGESVKFLTCFTGGAISAFHLPEASKQTCTSGCRALDLEAGDFFFSSKNPEVDIMLVANSSVSQEYINWIGIFSVRMWFLKNSYNGATIPDLLCAPTYNNRAKL